MGRGAGAESSRVRNPGEPVCRVAHCLRFYGDGVSCWVVSGQLSCLTYIWSDPVSFLVVCASLSQGEFQREDGKTTLWAGVSFLLLTHSKPFQLVLVTTPYSLSEPPVLRQHIHVVVIMPGQGRWLWSIVPWLEFPPKNRGHILQSEKWKVSFEKR